MIPSVRLNRLLKKKGFLSKLGVKPMMQEEVTKYKEALTNAHEKNNEEINNLKDATSIKDLKKIQKLNVHQKVIEKRLAYLQTDEQPLIGKVQYIKPEATDFVYLKEENDKVQKKLNKKLEKLAKKETKILEKLQPLLENTSKTKSIIRKIIKLNDQHQKVTIVIKNLNNNLTLLQENKLPRTNLFQDFKTWFSNIDYDKQKAIWGVLFVLPFVLGIVLIFLPSSLKTIYWSFFDVAPGAQGLSETFIGIKNYTELFTDYVIYGNQIFSVEIGNFVQRILIDIPVIIIFSILIAVLLNKKFKGHVIIKAIFFIPIVFNATLVAEMLNSSFGQRIGNESQLDQSFVDAVIGFFMNLNIGEGLIAVVLQSIDRILEIINLSGIQILIFIAAIQSIPNHLYEAAKIEGATKYEIFWKITIPMITPLILTAVVYTVVDGFTRAPITVFLTKTLSDFRYGLAAAISVVYLVINVVIIAVVYLIIGRRVFYYDKKK